MLDVLKGLEQKNLRVFSVEPNYWWDNNGYDFIEYAYLQVNMPLSLGSAISHTS